MVDMRQLPGSPTDLKSQAAQLIAAAANLGEAADRLANVATFRGYQSASVTEASKNATEIKGAVEKAEVRYRGAGEQLSRWADDLEELQKRTAQAVADWNGVDVAGPAAAVDSAQDEVHAAPLLSDERGEAKDHLRDMRELLDQAHALRADAERRVKEAREERDRLARHHAGIIRQNNRESGLDDGLWDKIAHWVANLPWDKILEVIKSVADWVALIATVAGILLCWVPFLGAGLLLVGRIASVVSIAVSIIQLLTGKVTLGEALVGILLAAAGGLGKVLKIGRLASLGRKGLFSRPGAITRSVKKSVTNERLRQTIKRKVKAGELSPERGKHYRDLLNRHQLRDVTDLPVRQAGESTKDYAARAAAERLERAVIDGAGNFVIGTAVSVVDDVSGGWSIDVGAVVDSGDLGDVVTSGDGVSYEIGVDASWDVGPDLSAGAVYDRTTGEVTVDLPLNGTVPVAVVSTGTSGVHVAPAGPGGGRW